MEAKPKNSAAFPRTGYEYDPSDRRTTDTTPQEGMSLRDYFAAKALPALVAASEKRNDSNGQTDAGLAARVAKYAYIVADAMLVEREKGGQ